MRVRNVLRKQKSKWPEMLQFAHVHAFVPSVSEISAHEVKHLKFFQIPRASRTSKKVGPVQKTGVLEEEPGSSKPIFYIWVLYGLNTGSAQMKPIFFGKNRVFPGN